MPTANQEFFDASIRHQVGIRRFSSGEVRRVLAILERADRELAEMLRKRLAQFGGVVDFRGKRFTRLLNDIRDARKIAMKSLRDQLTPTLLDLSKMEADREIALLKDSIPIEIDLAGVDLEKLRAIVTSRPFQGRMLREWYQTLEAADRTRLREAVQLGLAEGESVPNIVRRVAGTRAAKFRDGVLSITRRNAETVVRTAVNHVSNSAREAVMDANSGVIRAKRWTSTLDGRTSAICRARDGAMDPTPGNTLAEGETQLRPTGARPPAHPNCRSILTAVIDGMGVIGGRPTVTDVRTRRRREIDFRRTAKETGRSIQTVRREWADANIGRVPAKTDYNNWLRRQPAAFQDEVLGKTKGALYRRGDLDLNEFVDRRGQELTLGELAQTKPEAFKAANLSPEDF